MGCWTERNGLRGRLSFSFRTCRETARCRSARLLDELRERRGGGGVGLLVRDERKAEKG
jgi:hypothetical protein